MARTLCVSSAGDGTDGLTWATAFVTPNAALSAAADADEIRLAKGTYVLTATAELSGRTGVTISGGWDPSTDTREALSQSALTSAETFNGRLLTLTSVTDCRIEGVAFTNAFHYTEAGVAMGGAVYATNAVRLAFVDCYFRDNSAYSHAAPTDRTASAVPDTSCCALGGALCLDICPNATLTRCEFRHNIAEARDTGRTGLAGGGALMAMASTNTVIGDCIFIGNAAVAWYETLWATPINAVGGAVANGTARALRNVANISNGENTGAYADWPFHGWNTRSGAMTLSNCLFAANASLFVGTQSPSNPYGLPTGVFRYTRGVPRGLVTTWNDDQFSGAFAPGHKGSALTGDNVTMRFCTMAAAQGNGISGYAGWATNLKAYNCVLEASWNAIASNYSDDGIYSSYYSFTDCALNPRYDESHEFEASKLTRCYRDDPQLGWGFTPQASGAANMGWVPTSRWPSHRDVYVAPAGSDATGDGTSAKPWRTLTRALAEVEDEVDVHAAAGTYSRTTGETFPLRIRARTNVRIVGAGAGKTVVDGENVAGGRLVEIVLSGGVTLENLSLAHAYFTDPAEGSPEVEADVLSGATHYGAGIFVASSQRVRLKGVTVTGNKIRYSTAKSAWNEAQGGAGIHVNASQLYATDCHIEGNSIANAGWSVDANQSGAGVSSINGWTVWERCSFCCNTNATGQYAGAFAAGVLAAPVPTKYAFCSDVFRNCLIADNVSDGMDKRTSARGYVALGVGTSSRYGGSIRLENCTVAGNRFKDMTADYATNTVQAAFKVDTKVSLTNTIFWGESDHTDVRMHQDSFKSAALSIPAVNCLFRNDAGTASVDCLTGGTSPFRNRKPTPYALARGASAVDRGVAVGYGVKTETDYAGNPRLSGSAIDIGCYELQPPDGTVLQIR